MPTLQMRKLRLGEGSDLPAGRVALCVSSLMDLIRSECFGSTYMTCSRPRPGRAHLGADFVSSVSGGCQKMLLISPEGTVLLSRVRKHNPGSCRITGITHAGLFTHLAGALRKRKVGRASEEPFRNQQGTGSNPARRESMVGAPRRGLGPPGCRGLRKSLCTHSGPRSPQLRDERARNTSSSSNFSWIGCSVGF